MLDQTIQKNQICAVCIIYNPDAEFLSLFGKLCEQLMNILIIDNGSIQSKFVLDKLINLERHVTLLKNSTNQGLAYALNQAAAWARSQGFTAILLFDQDSTLTQNVLTPLLNICAEFKASDRIAIIGSNFYDRNSGKIFSNYDGISSQTYQESVGVFNSGSLVALDCHLKLGGYREDFFVDLVDAEFCVRAIKNEYRVIQSFEPTMIHSAGDPQPHYIGSFKVWSLHHKPWRYYYLTRNSIVMLRCYPPATFLSGIMTLRHIGIWALKAVLFEEDKSSKLIQIIKGAIAGVTAPRDLSVSQPVSR